MAQTTDLSKLERELEQLTLQLPRHSISPSIQARIDDLEEQIAELKRSGPDGSPVDPRPVS